jgi:hypothetical protein
MNRAAAEAPTPDTDCRLQGNSRLVPLACDSCAIGKAKTVFLGVGVGIGIGVALLKTDPES